MSGHKYLFEIFNFDIIESVHNYKLNFLVAVSAYSTTFYV